MNRSIKFRGQGMVEFALVVPILLIVVIGTLDFGIAFFAKVELANSAREGANYMVYHPTEGKANSFALVKSAVQTEGQNGGIVIAAADIDVSCIQSNVVNNTCPSGSTVVVTVRHSLPLAFDFIFNGPLQLVNSARMIVP